MQQPTGRLTPRHAAYLNHIMSCPGCYAPARRHCRAGARLAQRYHLAAHIGIILTTSALASRRRQLDAVPAELRLRVECICRRVWRRR